MTDLGQKVVDDVVVAATNSPYGLCVGLAADTTATETTRQVNSSCIAAMVEHLPGRATLLALVDRAKHSTKSK
jgi:hypothetical protein